MAGPAVYRGLSGPRRRRLPAISVSLSMRYPGVPEALSRILERSMNLRTERERVHMRTNMREDLSPPLCVSLFGVV